jgi:hypothetical protein
MKQRSLILLFGVCVLLGLLVITGSTVRPAGAESDYQNSPCEDLLKRILVRAGWGGINENPDVEGCRYFVTASNYYLDLNLSTGPSGGMSVFCSDNNSVPPCIEISFHGYPATTAIANGSGSIRWIMTRGGTEYYFDIFIGEGYDVIQFAEEILSAAEIELPPSDQVLPIPEVPTGGTDPADAPCEGVTPEDFRIGSQDTLACRLLCEETNWQSDEELWACISYYGGQSGENVPAIPGIPPGNEIPTIPDVPSAIDQPGIGGLLTNNPLVPLAGALIGTLLGWLGSVAATSRNTLRTFFNSLFNTGTNTGLATSSPAMDWNEWENNYIPPESSKPRDEPLPEQLHSVDISVQDSQEKIFEFVPELSQANKERVLNAKVQILDPAEFDAKYVENNPPDDKDIGFAGAFVNADTGETYICRGRAANYTSVHELMHVASNRRFGILTNPDLDEAVTEYFSREIAKHDNVPYMSEYILNGSVDVVEQIVHSHGEAVLRKAYFGSDDQGIIELLKAVDQQHGSGAFNKVVELLGREDKSPYPIEKQKALDLLRGEGLRGKNFANRARK